MTRTTVIRTLLALGLFACVAAPATAQEVIAFVDVHVVRMDGEGVLRDQVVIVRDGRITAVGPSAETPVPAQAARIEGAGRFLAPGLADMHTHLSSRDELALFVANGVTTARVLFGDPSQLQMRKDIEAGTLIGPSLHLAGPIIDGDPPVWPGSDVVTTAQEAVRVARAQHEAGYDFLKVYERLPIEAYEALVAEAALLDMEVHGHVPVDVGLELVLESGQRTIEHLTAYGPAMVRGDAPRPMVAGPMIPMVHGWSDLDPEKRAFFLDWTREAGTWNCPTLVVLERAFGCDEDGWADASLRPELGYVSRATMSFWRASPGPGACEAVKAGMPARYAFVKSLHDAGAGLLIGTDTPNPWVVPGFSIHGELGHFVAAGLTPTETLSIATLGAARFLGESEEFGAVRPGLRADLVLLASNPLEGVAAYAAPEGVMVRGRWLPQAELDELLQGLRGR